MSFSLRKRPTSVEESKERNGGKHILGVNLSLGPLESRRVLRHLESRNSDSSALNKNKRNPSAKYSFSPHKKKGAGRGRTYVGGLSGRVPDGGLASDETLSTSTLKDVDGLLGRAHVGSLGDESNTGGEESDGLLLGDLVLGRAGKRNVERLELSPGTGTCSEGACRWVRYRYWRDGRGEGRTSDVVEALDLSEVDEAAELDLELADLGDGLGGEAGLARGDEGALGVGKRDDDASELDDLESGVLRKRGRVRSWPRCDGRSRPT